MKTHGLMPLSISVLLTLFPAGCGCLSTQRARAKAEELRLQNRAGAEPAMLAAAKTRGAALLSLEAQEIDHRLACANGSDEAISIGAEPPHDICLWMESKRPGCQEWASDGRTFLIRNKGEKAKLVIPIQQLEGSGYARLARSGNKLFILMPRLTTREEAGTVTECECDGMPRVHCQSSFGFILDDAPSSPEIEVIWIQMAERYFRTICKATAV